MGFLTSIPFLSAGSGVLGLTVSLFLAVILLALWALVLLVLHPLHATIFVLAALLEYALISVFGFHLWFDVIAFFVFYVSLFGAYSLFLRRYLPLPQTEAEAGVLRLGPLRDQILGDPDAPGHLAACHLV